MPIQSILGTCTPITTLFLYRVRFQLMALFLIRSWLYKNCNVRFLTDCLKLILPFRYFLFPLLEKPKFHVLRCSDCLHPLFMDSATVLNYPSSFDVASFNILRQSVVYAALIYDYLYRLSLPGVLCYTVLFFSNSLLYLNWHQRPPKQQVCSRFQSDTVNLHVV